MFRKHFFAILLGLAVLGISAGALVAQRSAVTTQRPHYGCASTSSCGAGIWSDCGVSCTSSGCVCRQGLTDF